MKFIDTERQLVDIFIKPLDSSRFASSREGGGSLVFAIPMAWFKGDLVICLVHLYLFLFSCIFFILN
jgi:hypothetical protein